MLFRVSEKVKFFPGGVDHGHKRCPRWGGRRGKEGGSVFRGGFKTAAAVVGGGFCGFAATGDFVDGMVAASGAMHHFSAWDSGHEAGPQEYAEHGCDCFHCLFCNMI